MPSSFFFITPWKMLWKLDIAAVVKVISLGLGVICRVANEIIVEGKQTLTRKKISFFYSLRFSFHSHYFLFFFTCNFSFVSSIYRRISTICSFLHYYNIEAKSNTRIESREVENHWLWGATNLPVGRVEAPATVAATFQPRRTTGSADSVQQTTCQTARVAGRPRRDGWKYSWR